MTTKKELISSSELLTAFQKSEGKEPCMEEGGSNHIEEAYAPKGNEESCASPLSNPVSDSLFKKTVILQVKGNGISIDEVDPSRGGYLSTQLSKMVTRDDTSSRSRRTRARWFISL